MSGRKVAIAFAIPGDIDLPTGGYGYDRRLLAEWRRMGVAARHLALPGSFPSPTQADLTETRRQLLSCRDDETLLIDGLAYGAFPESLAAGLTGRVVALVHHPLALETGPRRRTGRRSAGERAAGPASRPRRRDDERGDEASARLGLRPRCRMHQRRRSRRRCGFASAGRAGGRARATARRRLAHPAQGLRRPRRGAGLRAGAGTGG